MRVVIDMCTQPVPYDLNFLPRNGGVRVFNNNSKFKAAMREVVRKAFKGLPVSLGAQVSLEFYVLFPAHIKVTSKPDLSNMLKTVEDAGTGIVYEDDSQICKELLLAKQGVGPEWKFRVIYESWNFEDNLWPEDLI